MNKHYRITSGDKLGAVRKKSSGAGVVNKPASLGLHTSPSGVSTQSTHSTKTNQSGMSQQSRISSLQQDLFAKLDQATSHRPDDDGFDMQMDELDRLEQLGVRGGLAEPRDKFEHLASLGKNYVASNAADGFEAQKQAYRAKEMAKKREEKRGQKRKLLSQVPRDQEKVILTGAGIEQIEADDDDDDDEPMDPEELRDDVGGLYELEDQEMIDLMNECLDEVKRDVLKYQRVRFWLIIRVKRMIWQRSEGSSRRWMLRRTLTSLQLVI